MRRLAAAAALACAAAPAAADPTLVLDRCTTLDPDALRAAIQRELAASRPDPRRDELILAVACPEPMTARLSIELPPPALPLGRSLDLSEVSPELRIKLLAIAAVELIDGAVAVRHPPPPPAAIDPGPARAPLPGERLPGLPGGPTGEPRPPALAPVRLREDRAASRHASDALVPRVGMRLFPKKPVPLAHLAIDYERRWFSIGAAASIGSNDVELGSVSAVIVTASASTQPLCIGGASRACVRARCELGIARVTARANSPMIVARDARSPYTQLGLAVDLEHAFGSLAALIAVEGAWAEGLVAVSQSEPAVQLDGAVVTVLGGLRWRP